jgi:ribosomal protein L7Ae-like RNA K-turn-binding protein
MDVPRAERAEVRALETLGLARRAGFAIPGTRAVVEAFRGGDLRAIVLAGDASARARDRLSAVLGAADVRVLDVASRRRLGAALGRDDLVVVGVTDEGFAGLLADLLPLHGSEVGGGVAGGPDGAEMEGTLRTSRSASPATTSEGTR